MTKRATKLAVLAVSSAVMLSIFFWFLPPGDEPTVRLVDVTEVIDPLLARRAADRPDDTVETTPPDESYPLVREPISKETAEQLFPQIVQNRFLPYDPQCYFWEVSNRRGHRAFSEHPDGGWTLVTNNLGFRNLQPVRESRPQLRVLVAGDSHTAGVVPPADSFASRLAGELREATKIADVETLNGGKGGYSFYNYLGVLEKHLDLKPDVFVMVVFGGNDFVESTLLHRYFNRLPPPPRPSALWTAKVGSVIRDHPALFAQSYYQLLRFAQAPGEEDIAFAAAAAVTLGVRRLAADRGIRFVCVYLPPRSTVERERIRSSLDEIARITAIDDAQQNITDKMADRYLAFLANEGIVHLDLRTDLAGHDEPLYWTLDHHLNVLGHEIVARALASKITDVLQR
jgi:lysophospholipase L1-like esterase